MKQGSKLLASLLLCAGILSAPLAYAVDYIDPPNLGTSSSGDSEDDEELEEDTGAFTDIEGHWAEETITTLAGMGLVTGMQEGIFAPNSPMNRAQFITVVVRYIYPTAEFFSGAYWYSGYFATAEAEGLLPMTFREKHMEESITRQEMAYIMIQALEALGETPTQLLSNKVIPDYSTIDTYYQENVIKAFSMGVISGKDNIMTFYPKDTATRAECTIVLEKMVNPDSRLEVNFAINPDAMTDMNRLDVSYTKSRAVMSYDLSDPNRPVAKVGDTVTINGKETVIAAHPSLASINGMSVPYVAGVALDQGISTNSAHGNVDDGFQGGGIHYNGEAYYMNPNTGEGYWESQWKAIATRVNSPRISGTTEGQVSTDDYKMWTWQVSTRSWVASYLYGRE